MALFAVALLAYPLYTNFYQDRLQSKLAIEFKAPETLRAFKAGELANDLLYSRATNASGRIGQRTSGTRGAPREPCLLGDHQGRGDRDDAGHVLAGQPGASWRCLPHPMAGRPYPGADQ